MVISSCRQRLFILSGLSARLGLGLGNTKPVCASGVSFTVWVKTLLGFFSSFICGGQYFCRDYPFKSMSADLNSDQLTQSLMVFEAAGGMCVSREFHAESWSLV